jgi:hypothetical protein
MQRLALSVLVVFAWSGAAGCGDDSGGAAEPDPNGAACSAGDTCLSGVCNDEGVCCDTACDGPCQTCGSGTCTLPPTDVTCAMECGQNDTGCLFYDNPDNQCASLGVCKDDTDLANCTARNGADDEACGDGCQWCQAGACVDIAADTDPLAQCGECQVCDGGGACRVVTDGADPKDECAASACTRAACLGGTCKLDDGTQCGAGCARCTNGSCDAIPDASNADPNGVCGPCQVCDGADGCRAADDSTDPKDECSAGGSGCEYAACLTGSCFAPAATVCGSPACDGTLQIDPFECDGAGACESAGTTPCAPNLCGANGCEAACTVDADCQGGFRCEGTTCVSADLNVVFVTSTVHQVSVDFTSLATADAICMERAAAAGLSGTFRAWLSDDDTDAIDRLGSARGWVRLDRLPFADEVAELAAGQVFYPPRVDEFGRARDTAVQTATHPDGTGDGQNCSNWSTSTGALSMGASFGTTGGWTQDVVSSCGGPRAFYCLGTDHTTAVAPVGVSGRQAFVSAASFTPSAGLAAADAICANEASAAALSGTFKALLPPGTNASPIFRFDTNGATWVRADGIALLATAAELATGLPLTGLSTRADGTYYGGEVRTGPETVNQAGGTSSCSGWTSTVGGTSTGLSYSTTQGWFSASTGVSCATPLPVYCLEQ